MKKTIISMAITVSVLFTSAAVAGGGKTKPKFMSFKQQQQVLTSRVTGTGISASSGRYSGVISNNQ